MAIFPSRIIKRMLNENADFLTKEQLDKHILGLNGKKFQPLETEWEVAVLNAFSKIGKVEHEPRLKGTSKLDLLFVSDQDSEARFVADVATVSDKGVENKKLLNAFEDQFKRRINEIGIISYFRCSIGEHPFGVCDVEVRLMLPPTQEFDKEIFNGQFKSFLKCVKQNPKQPRTHQILSVKTNILIEYIPDIENNHFQKVDLITPYVYTLATSKTQNCVYNALRKKAQNQFKKVSYSGPKGIILCDGGSDMFHRQPSEKYNAYYNAIEAVREFLRQNRSIDFVLMLSVIFTDYGRPLLRRKPFRKVHVEFIPNKSSTNLPAGIRQILTELERHFPEPFNTAHGVRETIRQGYDLKKFRTLMQGNIAMSEKEIKVSSNDIFALLAGAVTQEDLFKSWDKTISTRKAFKYFFNKKMRIVEVQVVDDGDFSNLIFKFDGPDAAISPFINPKA